MVKATEHFVETVGVRIQVREYGNAAGRPVFLMHGFPDAPVGFEALIGQFDTDKLRVFVPSLR